MNNLFHLNSLHMIDLTNVFERCYIHLHLKYLLYIFDLFVYLNSIPCNAFCDSIVSRPRSAASVCSTEVNDTMLSQAFKL